MRLDHLLSKEKEEVRVVMLLSFQGKAKYLLVVMRLWETPVPIPNTMVKTQEADGTMLETAWESRWLPGSLKDLLIDFEGTKQVWQYGSGRCTLKTAHR